MATTVSVVGVDTMSFAYLDALGQLELLRRLAAETHRLAVTKAVVRELQRSPRLGPLVQSWCDRGELELLSPCAEDQVSLIVSALLGTPRSGLVRRNRVDSELIEVVAFRDGAVLSSQAGIQVLAGGRGVPVVDLVTLFAWAQRQGLVSEADVDAITRPWTTPAAAATGAPQDFRRSFHETVRRRGSRLTDLVTALVG
jgi:hypothetical protein